jgi:hypothetical protein
VVSINEAPALSDIGITDMAIQTEETTPVKDDINIYKENRPKNMS